MNICIYIHTHDHAHAHAHASTHYSPKGNAHASVLASICQAGLPTWTPIFAHGDGDVHLAMQEDESVESKDGAWHFAGGF
jgi:hypothetical protein